MTTTLSFNAIAFNFGNMQERLRNACDPLHAAWREADSEQRADLRARWMLNHVAGALSISKALGKEAALVAAAKVLAIGKSGKATKDNARIIDNASSAFRYNVIRPEKAVTSGKAAPVPARVKTLAASMAQQTIDAGLTKAEFDALISELKKAVTFE